MTDGRSDITLSEQFLRYCIVGGIGTCLHFGLTIALVEGAGSPPTAASVVGFAAAFVSSYLLNRLWVFGPGARPWVSFARYALVVFRRAFPEHVDHGAHRRLAALVLSLGARGRRGGGAGHELRAEPAVGVPGCTELTGRLRAPRAGNERATAMGIHRVLERVTDRIRRRSETARSKYLAELGQMRSKGPVRHGLSCTNLAHGFAAAPAGRQDGAAARSTA